MKRNSAGKRICQISFAIIIFAVGVSYAGPQYDTSPPFKLDHLKTVKEKGPSGKTISLYDPKSPYAVFINYELGMHCVGFDISYCCVIPPYNSIQAQAIRTGERGKLPRLLSPDDGLSLHYFVRDNSYSEGNKMRYWNVAKDVYGGGKMDDPGDNMANYVWTHLFIYKDLEGTIPENWSESQRLHVGKQIQVPIDSGPTGKNLAGGDLAYAGSKGGNKVFTDSLIPEVKNIPLTLTSSYLWDALGLPLTAFNDSRRKGTIRSISEKDFQPYQYSVVQLRDKNGKPVMAKGKPIEFFGTNPVDIPNCYICHSGRGKAVKMAREQGLTLFDKEYAYWKKNYSDVSEFTARQAQASINILEFHDKHHGTAFLKDYNPNASNNRLGVVGSVNCADCHGDNISGNLQSPRPGATGYKAVKAKTLTEAVHSVHAAIIPLPDKAGRTQSCQACHPTHWQEEKMNIPASNPFQIVDEEGNPRFSNSDVRIAGGGCYLRRDAHTNPSAKPPFFLNEIGKWYFSEVSRKDENGKPVSGIRGLYCTNCHNQLAHELYNCDDLRDATSQQGKSLRNKPLAAVIQEVANGDGKRFKQYFADPVVGAEGEPLRAYYEKHTGATLVKATKDSGGKLKLFPWNAQEGSAVPYDGASAGKDWWLAAGEPHCADCHLAPFVESRGGNYFPVDQPNKYALYRYSKAHGPIACQSCHESIHGLYPVRYEGPGKTADVTSHQQALQFSPDGKYAGPVTCAACHRVNGKGVPVQLEGTKYSRDYWASVTLLHFMREGDEKLPIDRLVEKYPYGKSQAVVQEGWK
ncbi:MAG: cytochrome c3 family protein [Nitrospirae bacterium]|nr:cytochrome c3 family protein [Nitrospirota bacterium]